MKERTVLELRDVDKPILWWRQMVKIFQLQFHGQFRSLTSRTPTNPQSYFQLVFELTASQSKTTDTTYWSEDNDRNLKCCILIPSRILTKYYNIGHQLNSSPCRMLLKYCIPDFLKTESIALRLEESYFLICFINTDYRPSHKASLYLRFNFVEETAYTYEQHI